MKKFKVCVYAICKNEEQFVERWVKSMSEADEIYVLDTGSNDNTVKKLKDLVYTNEVFCWDSTIDDLLSINYYNIGLYDLSLYHVNKALEYDEFDERIISNKKLIEQSIGAY